MLLTKYFQTSAPLIPVCPYFSQCGGCALQNLSYLEQLQSKLAMLKNEMQLSGIQDSLINLVENVIAGSDYHYRKRIALQTNSRGETGFYQRRSNTLINLQSCPVCSPALEKKIADTKKLVQEFPEIKQVLLEEGINGVFCVLKLEKAGNSSETSFYQELLALAKKSFNNVLILENNRTVLKDFSADLQIPLNHEQSLLLTLPAGSFSQINWQVNQQLIQTVLAESLQLAKSRGGQRKLRILDLYSGAGNFSLPLAQAGCQVTGVECNGELIRLGRENAKKYGLEKNLKFISSSVEQFLTSGRIRCSEQFDLILFDPPRSGLEKIISFLPPAKKLILISCYLPSFLKDLKNLYKYGWNVKRIAPFDMFAQTLYLEVLSTYTR
ncbi:MAG: methyltransferase domain-containing protein [Deltaproteobacteria bacterium]|jgi:23S rRNA (uracil1939-C5)-methyltransferase|nr:methyltransferase domain-containing protein [Deltaproteobacteria bacterium]